MVAKNSLDRIQKEKFSEKSYMIDDNNNPLIVIHSNNNNDKSNK